MDDTVQKNIVTANGMIQSVHAFGIKLHQLIPDHLPFLLKWRNHPSVLPFMGDRRKVTLDILNYWYQRINKQKKALYYMVSCHQQFCGFCGISHIDFEKKSGESEIFLNPDFFGKKLSFRISLCKELVASCTNIKTLYANIRVENDKSYNLYCNRLKYNVVDVMDGFYKCISYESERIDALEIIANELNLQNEYDIYFK